MSDPALEYLESAILQIASSLEEAQPASGGIARAQRRAAQFKAIAAAGLCGTTLIDLPDAVRPDRR